MFSWSITCCTCESGRHTYLYNKQNITWSLGDMNSVPSWPCNILYLWRMLYNTKKGEADVFAIRELIVKLASKQTPRSRATVTEGMTSNPTLMVSNETLANC